MNNIRITLRDFSGALYIDVRLETMMNKSIQEILPSLVFTLVTEPPSLLPDTVERRIVETFNDRVKDVLLSVDLAVLKVVP